MINPDPSILVSVIVPCYNHGGFLKNCIDSVLAQSYNNWECIIIDNGSTDNTKEIASAYTDKRIKYIYTDQKGVSLARNLGVAQSGGQYILPLDADDKIHPSYLEKAVAVLQKDTSLKLVYCNAKLFGAVSRDWILPDFDLKEMLIENSIFCSAMFRRTDFDASGGYNENMKEGFEDWDFWISLLKNCGEVHKIPEILFYYRIRKRSRNSSLDQEKQLRLRVRIYENHQELYQKLFSIPELIFKYHILAKENKTLLQSKPMKIGTLIAKPFRFIKNIFNSSN